MIKKLLKRSAKISLMRAIFPPPKCGDWSCATTEDIEIILRTLLQGFIAIMGAIAVLMFIIGAYNYLLAYGSEEKAEKGKKTIIWSIVGIAITALAWVIVSEVWKVTTAGPPPVAPP